MRKKEIFGLLLFCLLFLMAVSPASSEEKSDYKDWKKGHLTAIGKGFIKVDGVRYDVSPDVVITGKHGNDLGSDLKNLRGADEIMFRILLNENIVEIRVIELTSCLWLIAPNGS